MDRELIDGLLKRLEGCTYSFDGRENMRQAVAAFKAALSQQSEPVASVPQDVELNQILGEYLTEELAAVAPDIDWYDGRYMNGLVSGILDVVMAGHARVPVEPTGKMWSAGRTAFDSVEDKVRYAMHSEIESAHRDSAPTVIWQAMLTASKERAE